MVKSSVLGFPRIGPNRELKKATESYWAGKITVDALLATGKSLREANWRLQREAGVDIIASNDFSFYDQVLDHIQMFNAIPERYSKLNLPAIDTYFAMGRGLQREATNASPAVDVTSLEMVKWFDSNYHYVRPTFSDGQTFKLADTPKAVADFLEAKAIGIETRPVLLGPISFLHLGKADRKSTIDPISLLDGLLPVYCELLVQLKNAGAKSVQIDEPVLVLDLPEETRNAFKSAYQTVFSISNLPELVLATYFGDILHNIDLLDDGCGFSVIHVDLVRAPQQLQKILSILSPSQTLSMGVVDGRNIWKTNFENALALINEAVQKVGLDRLIVATSSSLLHTPHTLKSENDLPDEVKNWFSFAVEKTREVKILASAVVSINSVQDDLNANKAAIEERKLSLRTNDSAVQKRQQEISPEFYSRKSEFPVRLAAQQLKLNLPLFPTTTIGSFPQTKEIRLARQRFTKGAISAAEYEDFIKKEIASVVKQQEDIGLDVLVHGEPERNDMVQYFGEQLTGFVFTTHGWVQSYGSRCVRPPIIVGDISRPKAMTVKESQYAQSLTERPVKGMLTGPITVLRWSFPRDDIHQSVQAEQLALALRDEVVDLEKAGINVIQVDEPALREGLPLRKGTERESYLDWAVKSFRLATSGVEDSTQIHSHFCYSEFQDFFHAIAALDADVLSIEYSKSDAKLLRVFIEDAYPRHIGPGVYDIHSPRVPSEEEIKGKIEEMLQYLRADQLWIDPDCGLKTRQWPETIAALKNMVAAAKHFRATITL
jgi:5-methyltetrahydropteroyltriglutamate--homocysteine methyltransferase